MFIAQALAGKGVDVNDQLAKAGFEKVKVEIVKAEYGSESGKKDVTALLQKRATDLPLITLPENTYNKSFGGDPAPGSEKDLQGAVQAQRQAGRSHLCRGCNDRAADAEVGSATIKTEVCVKGFVRRRTLHKPLAIVQVGPGDRRRLYPVRANCSKIGDHGFPRLRQV